MTVFKDDIESAEERVEEGANAWVAEGERLLEKASTWAGLR